ncbi:MAG: alpha-amylase family glycosyl hydrolase [Bacteroidetes bacterium]|nr:alpha-amylase family glycosyl hydrolase [Bacteroidota bacterium]
MIRFVGWISSFLVLASVALYAQVPDSVDVTFYYKPSDNPSVVYLPGEFNNWASNSNGVIAAGNPSAMVKDSATGIWSKIVRLRVGGEIGGGVPGAYQYKFNENGTASGWVPDPLNPLENAANNNNSIIFVTSPTVFYLLPNSKSGIVDTEHPVLTAYVFASLQSGVDTSSFYISIDTTAIHVPGGAYDESTKLLSFVWPDPLQNGSHQMILSMKNLAGNPVSDTASFVVQAGVIQILNRGGYITRKPSILLDGVVEDTSIRNVMIVRNGTDTIDVPATNGSFHDSVTYVGGLNSFTAVATDSAGATIVSAPFAMTYFVNHSPNAEISFTSSVSSITLSAKNSTDPAQGGALSFVWGVGPNNPVSISGVDGATSATVIIARPSVPGQYDFSLVATDSAGNRDTTRSYFDIDQDDSITFSTYASNPEWVRMGRIYELFFDSFTPQQTINAATQKLDYIAKMGFNIIWVMPVMKNNQPMDNGSNTGYNIVDFYTVAPEYGTNADFKSFVDRAHQLGMKVILDVTPNHTSFNHPFVQDARLYGTNSFYWDFYQHHLITNPNYHPNLPEAITSDGFVYYGAYSDQLLNYNWADVDARAYMDDVYKWWVENMGVDGFRFDSYWGPHDRANNGNGGENEMGTPTRTLLKHVDPNIFLLGETAGTGVGTEVNYADDGGGLDAAYDWNMLHNAIQSFNFSNPASISTLNQYVTNFGPNNGSTMGYEPGPDALFMRCMENQDEDRIAYTYGSYQKTMPMATVIFTVPGIPMMYSGQEVGWGLGISNFDQRRRGIIDWSYPGESILTPHYEKLAWIRGTFPAFSTQLFNRLSTGNVWVYGYTRPYPDQNGIALENFGDSAATAQITLVGAGSSPNVEFPGGVIDGKTYYMNDVYNETSDSITFTGGQANFTTALPPYGSAIYVLSDSVIQVTYPVITGIETGSSTPVPTHYVLAQNYPNPFNPTTVISYQLPRNSLVTLKVYDVLGREVRTLVDSEETAGIHEAIFNGSDLASGVYFYKLVAGGYVKVDKMMILK